MSENFERGMLVRHTGKFLRSIGWHIGVPINGVVLAGTAFGSDSKQLLDVYWSDGSRGGILAVNVEPDRKRLDSKGALPEWSCKALEEESKEQRPEWRIEEEDA